MSITYTEAMDLLETIDAAYVVGYDKGYADGRNDRRKDADAAMLHAEAARIATLVMKAPERDPEADRQWRERQNARWSA